MDADKYTQQTQDVEMTSLTPSQRNDWASTSVLYYFDDKARSGFGQINLFDKEFYSVRLRPRVAMHRGSFAKILLNPFEKE